MPVAITKPKGKQRGLKMLPAAVHGHTSFQLPSGVNILSGEDSAALDVRAFALGPTCVPAPSVFLNDHA